MNTPVKTQIFSMLKTTLEIEDAKIILLEEFGKKSIKRMDAIYLATERQELTDSQVWAIERAQARLRPFKTEGISLEIEYLIFEFFSEGSRGGARIGEVSIKAGKEIAAEVTAYERSLWSGEWARRAQCPKLVMLRIWDELEGNVDLITQEVVDLFSSRGKHRVRVTAKELEAVGFVDMKSYTQVLGVGSKAFNTVRALRYAFRIPQ